MPVAVAALAIAPRAPALAHVVATPEQAQAGSSTRVGFVVQHGCYGTGTTGVTVHLPPGVTQVRPDPAPGFQTRLDTSAGVVAWTGGVVPDATRETFTLQATLPDQPGQSLSFPITQTCQEGRIEWRDTLRAGQDPDDLDTPAATIALTAAPVASLAGDQDSRVLGAEDRRPPAGGVAAGGGGASGSLGGGWARAPLALLLPALVAAAATLATRQQPTNARDGRTAAHPGQ